MPVEIKKLVLQAKVADTTRPTPRLPRQSAGSTLSEEEIQRIVDACVKQVLKALNREKAR